MAGLVLIVGGARSGKSRFAQQLAERLGGGDVLFVATAEPGDDEMAGRIAHHRQSRPSQWALLETSQNVGKALRTQEPDHAVILIDCLTLLVSNVMLANEARADQERTEKAVQNEVDELLEFYSSTEATMIIVSGQVGHGVVPPNPLGRLFRDLLGRANQTVSAAAASTYMLVAGNAIDVQRLATSVEHAAQLLMKEDVE